MKLYSAISLCLAQMLLSPTSSGKSTHADGSWKNHVCGSRPSSRCVAENHALFVKKARKGDPYAAGSLFGSLIYCAKAPSSELEIEKSEFQTFIDGKSFSREDLLSWYIECRGLPKSTQGLLNEIAVPAARAGHTAAIIHIYESKKTNQTPKETTALIENKEFLSLAERHSKRDPRLLDLLSRIYKEGIIVPLDATKA